MVTCVPHPEVADDGGEGFQPVQAVDGEAQHVHQLPALATHVAVKQLAEGGIELEKPGIEDHGRPVGVGGDLLEGGFDEGNFLGIHEGDGVSGLAEGDWLW